MIEPAEPKPSGDQRHPLRGGEALLLAFIILLALALRLRAIDWGLPAFTEEATPFRKAIEFWGAETGRGTLDPQFYNYPTLTFYLQFAWLGLAGLVGSLTGAWSGLSEFRTALATPAPALVMASRGLNILIGALTIVPVYRLARSMTWDTGPWAARLAGTVSALVLATGPVHVAESRVIGTDVPMAFCLAMALWFLDGVVRRGSDVDLRSAGVAAGLAISCKYPAALVLLPLLVATAWPQPKRAIRMAGFAFLAFALTSPFVLFNLPAAWQAVSFERWHMVTGHFRVVHEAGFRFYLSDLLPRALGWPAFGLAIMGIGLAIHRGGTARLVAIFALTGLAWIGSWRVAFDRYVLLLVPALSVLAGYGVGRLVDYLPHGLGWTAATTRPRRSVEVLVLLLLLAWQPFLTSWHEGTNRRRPSTRDAAIQWARASIPPGSLAAVERYSIEAMTDSLALLVIPFDSVDPHRFDPAYSLPYYAPFEWIVLSSALYDRYLSRIHEFPAQSNFYDGVARHLNLVAEFRPERGLTGPTIRIFRRPPGTVLPDFRAIDPGFYGSLADKGPMTGFLTSLGGVLARGGRTDLALAAIEQAVALAPDDVKALTNLAILRGERGEYLAALNSYRRALALAPNEPRLNYNLGRLHEGKESWSEAAAAYQRTTEASPRMIEAWWGLYAAQIHLDDRAGARHSLTQIVSILPPGPRADQVRELIQELGRRPR